MPVFEYRQNNSGGFFRGPIYVFVQAKHVSEANYLAEAHMGIYFDGVADDIDCDCCGDRWSEYPRECDDSLIESKEVVDSPQGGFYPILLYSGETKYISL